MKTERFETQLLILKALKENGPMSILMLEEFIGRRVEKSVRSLLEKGNVSFKEDVNPLLGRKYKFSIVRVYSFVKPLDLQDPFGRKESAKIKAIEKACELLRANGYNVFKE